MSNITWAGFLGPAFAALLVFGACRGAEDIPAVVPNVETADEPKGHSPRFPSQIELELCDRRVPAPRC
jgi:hypothetical protein